MLSEFIIEVSGLHVIRGAMEVSMHDCISIVYSYMHIICIFMYINVYKFEGFRPMEVLIFPDPILEVPMNSPNDLHAYIWHRWVPPG